MTITEQSGPLQTVDRALQILSWFTPSRPEMTVTHVARELGVSKSVASRLLSALEARQFVTQDVETERFRLGVRNLDLGALFLQQHRLVSVATPYLEQLSQDPVLQARANLFILDDGDTLRLVSFPARQLTRLRMAPHCTAAGKVLLSAMADDEISSFVDERGLPSQTPHTISSLDDLLEEIRQTRLRGYAADREEANFGTFCYAAPIRDAQHRTVGAASLSVSAATRPGGDWEGHLIQRVLDATRKIADNLGSGAI